MARIVLTDASPLITLSRIDGLKWLAPLFGQIWVPSEVRREVFNGFGSADETDIRRAEESGILRAWPSAAPLTPDLPDLDEGEAACIRIALGHDQPTLLLMDDLAGRSIATEHGLSVAGTLGIVGLAKARGLIASAHEVLTQLHSTDFRVSADLIERVLRQVGEWPPTPRRQS